MKEKQMNYPKTSTRFKIHRNRVLTQRIKHAMLSSNGDLVLKLSNKLIKDGHNVHTNNI